MLAVSPIRGDLQAHLPVARVASSHRRRCLRRYWKGRTSGTSAAPDFGWLMLPLGAEKLGSAVAPRITALVPKEVSGGNLAPALRFANLETRGVVGRAASSLFGAESRFGMNPGAVPPPTSAHGRAC